MNVAYFPGCSLHAVSSEYDKSTHLVCERLEVNLREVEDWNCCGATAGHSMDHELTMGLNTRNLAQASLMNMDPLVIPCPGCFNRLKNTSMGLKTSSGMVRGEERSVKNPPQGLPRIMNLLQFLVEVIGLKRIAEPVKIPLEGLKLAAYYGCLTTRPRKVAEFDDPEQPVSMDRILNTLGAETVLWSHKTECCGGPFITSEVSIALDLSRQVLEAARHSGAEAIVVACPMCQLSLDSRQVVVRRDQVLQPRLPIIYFTQLIALAYGFPIRHTGLKSLLINPLTLLAKKGLA